MTQAFYVSMQQIITDIEQFVKAKGVRMPDHRSNQNNMQEYEMKMEWVEKKNAKLHAADSIGLWIVSHEQVIWT